jgi:hypothetical protein
MIGASILFPLGCLSGADDDQYNRDEVSRPGTPGSGSPAPSGSQLKEASGPSTPLAAPPLPRPKANKFEEMLAKVAIDVDLDF